MDELLTLKPKLTRLKLSDEVERRDFKQMGRRLTRSGSEPDKTLETFDFRFNPRIHEPPAVPGVWIFNDFQAGFVRARFGRGGQFSGRRWNRALGCAYRGTWGEGGCHSIKITNAISSHPSAKWASF